MTFFRRAPTTADRARHLNEIRQANLAAYADAQAALLRIQPTGLRHLDAVRDLLARVGKLDRNTRKQARLARERARETED